MKKFLTIAVLAMTLTALSGCSWLGDKISGAVNEKVGEVNEGIKDVTEEISEDFDGGEEAAPAEGEVTEESAGE